MSVLTRVRLVSLTGLAIAALVYIAGNLLVEQTVISARMDLTERALFTLSDGTRTTLSKIENAVELHFFYSEDLGREVPFYAGYARRIRTLLREMEVLSDGGIVVQEHDPEPYSDTEDLAVSLGVQGVPVEQGGDPAYLGLAGTNNAGGIEAIPFFQPDRENLLEYDLVEVIYALSAPDQTVVGLISSLPLLGDIESQMQGVPSHQWALARELTKGYELVNLPQSFDELPRDIRVLMIVHPRDLGPREQYVIEQFLFQGGRALVFLDPKSEAPSAMRSVLPTEVSSSTAGLGDLLRHWGVRIPSGSVIGDQTLAWRVNAGTAQRPVPADYVAWLQMTNQNMADGDPVTAHLPTLNLASAGYIEHDDSSSLELEALLTTTENSAPIPVERVTGPRPDIAALAESFEPDRSRYVLAARLAGRASSFFTGDPPPRLLSRSENQAEETVLNEGPVNLILVADSDLLQDHFWLQFEEFFGREVRRPFAANATFVLNAIDNLGASDELIELRSRGVSYRPFDRIEALRERAEISLRSKEQALGDKLRLTKERIASLSGVRQTTDPTSGQSTIEVRLSAEERAEIEKLRSEMLSIRGELRDVRRELHKDVETLQSRVEFVNVVLMPLAVAVIACAVGVLRMRQRRRHTIHG